MSITASRRTLVALAALALTAGCTDAYMPDVSDGPSGPIGTGISPRYAQLQIGQSLQFSVTLRDDEGRPFEGASLTWKVADPTIARVTQDGTVTAASPGFTAIIVSSPNGTTQASVTVLPRNQKPGNPPLQP